MKNVLAWIKSNVITVISGLVIIASVAVIGWVFMHGGAIAEKASDDVGKIDGKIKSYSRVTVPVPPAEVDAPPEDITGVTINEVTLKHLEKMYGKMNSEYEKIFAAATERNRHGHVLLLPGVLPTTDASHIRHEARVRYRAAFERMFGPYEADTDEPRLNADGPLDPEELQAEMRRVEEDFRPGGYGAVVADNTSLTESDRKALQAQKTERAEEMLKEQAQLIHLYAVPDIYSPAFPFQVGAWSTASGLPSLKQIWDGHMELWIQQDIARAIEIANQVDQPDRSVIEAPVKRLISIDVVPGYVGLHTLGGMGQSASSRSGGGGAGYGGTAATAGGSVPAAQSGPGPDSKLSVNFHAGPTGRISNAIYDVRHVRVVAVVDFQQLPKFFDAIGQVNFMTVLECQVRDVDEYQALTEGFVYGKGDAVRVDMLIETIWLRDWTTKLMPPQVLTYLGITPPQATGQDQAY